MTYEKYLEIQVARGYRSLEQYQSDTIVEALIAVGFTREEAYQRALDAMVVKMED